MKQYLTTLVGKTIQSIMGFTKSGGQALPGLIIERLNPSYLATSLVKLPEGVVVITGTNGKTTTAKMVVELLRAEGKKVINNSTGSNLTRGIVSGLLKHSTWSGRLDYDIAVLEIDEAFAKKFVELVKPEWVVALNVTRDQLDRFGEVDKVAELVGVTMRAATKGLITNSNDPLLSKIAEEVAAQNRISVNYFGVASDLLHYFPSDKDLVSVGTIDNSAIDNLTTPLVELTAFNKQNVSYKIANRTYPIELKIIGQHNFQNAAAALALIIELLPNTPLEKHIKNLGEVTVAFGRGEVFKLKDGSQLQLVLVKNPASFRQSLASYIKNNSSVIIAINDNYADSRDVSWLWDVDFSSLKNIQVVSTTGSRAADMALRLQYDDIKVGLVEPSLTKALEVLIKQSGDKIILSTYTAMLEYYSLLSKKSGKL